MAQVDERAYKQPPTKQFYCVLLKYEERANKQELTFDELIAMTKMYGDIVSYYDAHMDPIKYYFMEKLQTQLSEMLFLKQKSEAEALKLQANLDRRVSLTTMKHYRQKKLTHMMQLQETKQDNDQQFKDLVGTYLQNVNEMDQNIKQQFQQQDNNLNQRLQSRNQKRRLLSNKQSTSTLSNSNLTEEDMSPIKNLFADPEIKRENVVELKET